MIDDVLFTANNFDAEKELERICSIVKESDKSKRIDIDLTAYLTVDNNRICNKNTNDKIDIIWSFKKRKNDTFVILTIKNKTEKNIIISDLSFESNISNIVSKMNSPRLFGWNSWGMSVNKVSNQKLHSENVLHISDSNGQTFFAGFLTLSRTKVDHFLNAENNKYIWSANMNFGKYYLSPNDTFQSEILFISDYQNPYSALEDWAANINTIYAPDVNTKPTVCWAVGNMRPNGEKLEDVVLQNLDIINKKFSGFNFEYVWTSQSNLKNYTPGNWLKDNLNEIPSGLKMFTEKIKEKGFKHGVWVSPFWFFKEAEDEYSQHYDHLVRDKNGNVIINEMPWCWKYEEDNLPTYHMHKCTIDGTHPKSIEYIKDIFSKYRDMGISYYMLDFLDINDQADYYDKSLTPWQSGYNILKTIRETAGRDTHMQTAVSSSPGFTGIINAARIGRDFGEGRPIDRNELNDWKNATNVLHDMHYSCLKEFLVNTAHNYFTHQKTYMNDMNVLMVDSPYPVEYSRFAVTLFGLYGSTPLVISGDFRDMRDDRLNMIKLVLPRTELSAKPIDLFTRVQPDDYSRIQALHVKTDWDEYTLVGIFNPDYKQYDLNLSFKDLNLVGHQIVYDFWNEEYRGIFENSFPVSVAAESCKLLRLTKKREHPWIMGTNMHIQQGKCDIKSIKWNKETLTLSGIATRPKGEKGSVFVHSPRNFKLINRGKCHILKELLDHNLVIEVPLNFKSEEAEFELNFEEWNFYNFSPIGLMPYSNIDELKDYMKKNYSKESTRVFE